MKRNLKSVGLTLVAILAVSGMAASSAQAQGKFTWAAGTTKLVTRQNLGVNPETGFQQWQTTNGNIQCEEVEEEAPVTGTEATEITAENIHYQNAGKVDQCTGPGGTAPKIEFNGCDYLYTLGQTIGETGMETTGQTHIKCPTGKQITFTSALCQFHIPAQSPGGHIIYHTVTGAPNDVTKQFTLTGIIYQGTGICTSGTNGTYSGNYTVKGFNASGVQQSIEVH